jgi:predicted nucleic acid-binding protein
MEFTRLYLDTAIFIELAEVQGEIQTLLYNLIETQMQGGERFLCTSELALAELLVGPYRDEDDDLIQLYDNWIVEDNSWLDVKPVTREVLWSAALVRRQFKSVKLPDAIHLASAIGFECSHFLTADKRIPGQVRLKNDRWRGERFSPELSVILPTAENLRAIIESRP